MISDENYPDPYLYMNSWPFNEKVTQIELPIGEWHTSGWNGIKVEWQDLTKYPEQKAAEKIYELFQIAKKNFD